MTTSATFEAWARTMNGARDSLPLDFNGYVSVARPAATIPASDVKVGDLLILTGYVSRVTAITRREVKGNGYGLHFSGSINIIRFPHEYVSVIHDPDWTPQGATS